MLDAGDDAGQRGNDKLFELLLGQACSGKASLTCPPLAVISARPGGDRKSSVFTARPVPRDGVQSWGEKLAVALEGCSSGSKRRAGGLRHCLLAEGRELRWLQKPKPDQP